MNTCPLPIQIQLLHDQELSPLQAGELRAHLAICPSCQAQLASLEDLGSLLAYSTLPELRPLMLAQLHQQLDQRIDQRLNQKAEVGVLRLAQWLTAAAAAILLVSSLQLFFVNNNAAADTSPSLAWEMTNAMLTQDSSTGGVVTNEHSLAAWIVSDLSASTSRTGKQE